MVKFINEGVDSKNNLQFDTTPEQADEERNTHDVIRDQKLLLK